MKREYYATQRCSHEGCNEVAHYRFTSRREEREWRRLDADKTYFCLRHTPTTQHITAASQAVTICRTLRCGLSKKYPNLTNHYWAEESKGYETGFVYGDGWNAYADDFPIGTVIRIETKIGVVKPETGEIENASVSKSNAVV